jgi:hypothetical protein
MGSLEKPPSPLRRRSRALATIGEPIYIDVGIVVPRQHKEHLLPAEEGCILGDLHMGGGRVEPALEDLDQDARLASFIDSIAGPGVTLFINGDFIDFPRIPPYEVPELSELLWTEGVSPAKAHTAMEQHPKPFDALSRTLSKNGSAHILVGNHDLGLAWPAVRRRPGAPVDSEPLFREGPEDSNELYLERVCGIDFMLSVHSDLERRYPYADNAKPKVSEPSPCRSQKRPGSRRRPFV